MDPINTEDKFIIINIKQHPIQRYSSNSPSISPLIEPLPILPAPPLVLPPDNRRNYCCILLFIIIVLFIILYICYSLLSYKK